MPIDIRFDGLGKRKWDNDPRVPLVAAKIWHHLARIASKTATVSFAGEAGVEKIRIEAGIRVYLYCRWESSECLRIMDIHIAVV